ncbi:hypothetical protein GGR53DRAFT_462928 [Hypoxylon sp. FL1150]|nr:hypothetical protein GGR53DRAFT_462928 [Hypoxylon sp. FL1150]
MATRLPHALPRRPTAIPTSSICTPTTPLAKPSHTPLSHTPSRPATIIRRPRRPYTFTQLVVQTDGSTYTMRTTSPVALYKSTKDTRNHVLWQPSDQTLRNVEVDEAGKLAAFRERFGRGWDAEKTTVEDSQIERLEAAAAAEEGRDVVEGAAGKRPGAKRDAVEVRDEKEREAAAPRGRQDLDALSDLISSYGAQQEPLQEPKAKPPKKK